MPNNSAQFDNQPNIDLSADSDLVMERILDNINNTPLGQVLKRIASLPECSQKKVLSVRRQLSSGSYDLNGRIDTIMDKVLEDVLL